jgi:hypothetical protein
VRGRDRNVLMVVALLAAIAASWMFVISPKRDQAAKLSAQLSAAQTQLTTLRSQLVAGQAAKREFATSYASIARLGEAVPADDNVPSLIYQIQSAASRSRVDFRALQLNGAGGAAPTTPGTAASTSLPPGATQGTGAFSTEPFSFTFQGNFFHLSDFFGRLQKFVVATSGQIAVRGRLMTLDSISLTAGPHGFPQIAASISATTFLLPASQGLTAGASPVGPASVGTQPVASTTTTAAPATPPAAAIGAPVK